jgi:prolyl 4-hydroxylase
MKEADRLHDDAVARLVAGDVAGAREAFRRAGEMGRVEAAVIFVNFLASGRGGPRDWPAALRLLGALAQVSRRSARELALIETMALTEDGDPVSVPSGIVLSDTPHLTRFDGLFTPAECGYLIEAATPMLEPSVVVDTLTGRQVKDPVRSSDGVGFTWPLENPAVHALGRRIARASGTEVAQGEPLQILRYRPGQEYKTHYDAIPGWSNQRVATMLVWLNDGYEGGETWFPTPGLAVRGGPGDALLFCNVGPDGRRDAAAAHAGRPVTAGEKLLASRWIRARPFHLLSGGR